ncbi:MAG: ATP-dependent DNA helicase RecG [Candidatus Omnitrophica bacterium]|nr:ATP-dependent DNA helicase RecG [Candidatus Omnitrophota bacterium]
MKSNLLEQEVRYLKGVGPKKAMLFQKMGITHVGDLLAFFPHRHEDRANFKTIESVSPGEFVTLQGQVVKARIRPLRSMSLFEVIISDGTSSIAAVWFNQPFLKKIFKEGQHVVLSGVVEYYRGLQIKTPEYEFIEDDEDETIHTGRIVPIYPLKEGLRQKNIRSIMFALVAEVRGCLQEYMPDVIMEKYDFIDVDTALQNIHFPESLGLLEHAKRRIVYEEFLCFQLGIAKRFKDNQKATNVFKVANVAEGVRSLCASLPFELTGDQEKVIGEIVEDLNAESPMNRLLQGDVGSGKTLVACTAMRCVIAAGYQVAFLIPTEILVDQHCATLQQFLEPFNIRIGALTGSTGKKDRKSIIERMQQGELDIVIGTHALLEEDVTFKNLGLVVIDEQHKFGVKQRANLLNNEHRPHLLVMTATPIPRTLGLTVYGDLKISVIREMPKGRKPIRTYWVGRLKEKDMFDFLKKRIVQGEQIYFLFPLVEETEKLDLKAATKEYDRLRQTVFKGMSVGLIHGRLKRDEKEDIMRRFKHGEIKILVATTVIEVGIDNPNATCMVIEHAERFGLSQLHQLRGRVGRGAQESYCFLVGDPKTDDGRQRLTVMTKTTDGFVIAEEDLKLRGPGDFLGTRQSGVPLFFLANIMTDQKILEAARRDAFYLLEHFPDSDLRSKMLFNRENSLELSDINN